ncbi:MAG: DUF2953 domain-containing protein [Clostridia bacterium]|nr:DUF2953 domain-containing protein [Clostridia bacterium]
MVFIFLIFFSVLLSRIKIKVDNFKFELQNEEHLNKDFKISITIFLLQIIPIFKLNINKNKLKKINIKNKLQKQVKKINLKRKTNKKNISLLKILIPDIKVIKSNIKFGTENAAITAYIYGLLKTVVVNVFKSDIKLYPVFNNQNELNIYLEGIFEFKLIHIINKIIIYNKGRRGFNSERTSNRRTYAYSHE